MHARLSVTLSLGLVLACPAPTTTSPEPATPRTTNASPSEARAFTMAQLRAELDTQVFLDASPAAPAKPPAGVFELVRYPAELGDNLAYVTPPRPGTPGPAIVWVHGGFDWGIDTFAWEPAPRDNDQSARAFREAGLTMMLPALRGSNGNPGRNECMAGEVDDLIAAARFLASRPDVDPERVYLGGHSTGGTLALLAAQSTDLFAGVFAFGPVEDVAYYNECAIPAGDGPEALVRRPSAHLDEIATPTFVIEGAEGGNITAFPALEAARGSAPVHIIHVPLADHFSVLAPGTEVVAQALLEGRDLSNPDALNMPEILAALLGDGAPIQLPTMTAVRLVRAQHLPEAATKGMRLGAIEACKDAETTACDDYLPPLGQATVESEAALLLAQSFSPEQLVAVERFYSSPAAQRVMVVTLRNIQDPNDPTGQAPELDEAEQKAIEAFLATEHGRDYFTRANEVTERLGARLNALVQ